MGKKIKILTVIRHPVGGIRTYLKYTYGKLDPEKYQFTILAAKDDETKFIKEDLKEFAVDIREVHGKHLVPLFLYKLLIIIYKNKYHVIHSQGLTAGIIASVANALTRIPHIVTSHDVFRKDQFTPPFGFIKKKIIAFFLNSADAIQSVSHDAQSNLLQFLPSLSKNKVVVITNGISIEHFCHETNSENFHFRKEIGVENDILLFGFLGRFMPQKGFIYLIDAVEELSRDKNISKRFKVVAVNNGAYIREYKTIIQEKGLTNYFIFFGFTPEIGKIIVELDAVIMPSLWEAFGLLAIEAFVLGCPLIASNCIGLREVINNTPAIVVEKGNASSIAEAIKKVLQNPSSVKQKSSEFISIARERFNSQKTADQLATLFNKLISSRNIKRS